MNPMKLIDYALWIVVGAVALGVVGFVGKLWYDSNRLAEIRAVDAKIDAANDRSNAVAAKQEARATAHYKRNAAAVAQTTKDLTDAKPTPADPDRVDRALRDYHRVLNDALRGAQ